MKNKLFILIFILLILKGTSTTKAIQPNQLDPFVEILTDSESYIHGEKALFIISSNVDDEVLFEVNFENQTLFTANFFNLSQSPDQYLWNIEPHAANGSYIAFAWLKENPNTNKTKTIGIFRESSVCETFDPLRWNKLQLNISAVGSRNKFLWIDNKIENFEIEVTNLLTNESITIEDIGTFAVIEDYDDSIFYQIGNAIKIEVLTINGDWYGELIFAAIDGFNVIEVTVFKTNTLQDQITGIIAATVIIVFFTVTLIRNYGNSKKRRINNYRTDETFDEFDPTDITEIR